jgi:hypothetical protein
VCVSVFFIALEELGNVHIDIQGVHKRMVRFQK